MKHTEETKEKIRKSKIGDKNPNWKGDDVKLTGLHAWIRTRLPKKQKCECCKKVPSYDLANISQEYKRDVSDWEWLCRKCHMVKDGRLKKIREIRESKRKYPDKFCRCGKKINWFSSACVKHKDIVGDKNPCWRGGKPLCICGCGKTVRRRERKWNAECFRKRGGKNVKRAA